MRTIVGVVIALTCMLFGPSNCLVQAEARTKFKITIENLSDFDLSPGGYVIHPSDYRLFEVGKTAAPAVKALCESGATPDFLYYVRKDVGQDQAFNFLGGVKARSKVEATIVASPHNRYLSFMHKVSFTDDTCVGEDGVALFSNQGEPLKTEVALFPLDIGTRENLKTSVPKHEMLAQFSWSYWRNQDTIPAAPISASPFLRHIPMAKVTIEPQ